MNFSKLWQSFYGEAWPIAHLLRESHSTRWLRFHALPDSQRYPQTEGEAREILRRADVLATEILGHETACLWFFPDYAPEITDEVRGHFFGRQKDEDGEVTMRCSAAKWEADRFETFYARLPMTKFAL